MSTGWCFLATMVVAYGVANLLQSVAAARTTPHRSFHPSLLLRLAGHRPYLFGLGFQVVGFVLAFLARRDLPLFLVQASIAAGLGVTALIGVLVLGWKLPGAEVALLGLLFVGVGALVISAQPAPARAIGPIGVCALVIALGVVATAGFFAVRLHGAPGIRRAGLPGRDGVLDGRRGRPAAGLRGVLRRLRRATRCCTS